MTVERVPLRSWRFPDKKCINGDVFPSGRPKFGPFPDITNLINANFCPVAILHDLLHGSGNALIPSFGKDQQRGEIFHSFIAFLKLSLKTNQFKIKDYDYQTQIRMIKGLFHPYASRKGFSQQEAEEFFKTYLEPWMRRKLNLKEIELINEKSDQFFEISLGNSSVNIFLDKGVRHYPLRGRIDEIDINSKKLIERTIKGKIEDNKPPILKDYQIWLLWKIIISLKPNQLPSQWGNIDFSKFDLIVETPHHDFVIDKENQTFEKDTHSAFAWINDIGISTHPGILAETYKNQICDPLEYNTNCAHPWKNCFKRDYDFPECRQDIKKEFKPWYRHLLWERMWEGDLLQYQIYTLSREQLISKKLISEGKILSFKDNKIVLQLTQKNVGWLGGYDEFIIIRFGTLFCGKREKARLLETNKENNSIVLKLHGQEVQYLPDAIIFPIASDIPPPIFQEPPSYLKSDMQRGLLKIQKSGAIKPDKAHQRSIIQLMEGVFGRKKIIRGSK